MHRQGEGGKGERRKLLLNEHRTTLHRKGGGERKLERRDSLLNAFRHVKLKNAIFLLCRVAVGLVTKAPRKPYENRTKTVKAPYRESY